MGKSKQRQAEGKQGDAARAPGKETSPSRARGAAVVAAALAALAAILARCFPRSPADTPADPPAVHVPPAAHAPRNATLKLADLEPLRAGDCGLGTQEAPGDIPVLDYSDLGDLRFPGGLRCPVIVQGLEGAPFWRDLARWSDLVELERHTPAEVTFDASSDGGFLYWDNNSLLSSTIRDVGKAKQGYAKVHAGRRAFFAALLQGRGSPFGSVRYGGKFSRFSGEAAQKVGVPPELAPSGGTPVEPSLWLSSAGSFSTAHYDNWHNVFIMIGGEKHLFLSPQAEYHQFHIYPGTHPLARQARRHYGASMGSDPPTAGSVLPDTSARVLAGSIRRGDAIFIPAGWFHHITARTTAVTVSLTTNPLELNDYNTWIRSGTHSLLPFTSEGEWTSKRLAAAMRVFVPVLMESLGYSDASAPEYPVNILVNRSYSRMTRIEMGLPGSSPKPPICASPPQKDRKAAALAAKRVALVFERFNEDLRIQYLLPYLESIFSKVADGHVTTVAQIMGQAVDFAGSCVKPLPKRGSG